MVAQAAYGIRLESEVPLAGLPAARGDELGTVRVVMEPARRPGGPQSLPAPEVMVEVDGRPLSFHVDGGLAIHWGDLAFDLSFTESLIRVERRPEAPDPLVQEWLLQYTLPLLLQTQRRLRVLHGGAVQVGAHAAAFLAASGGGKSTLVEYFLQRGHALLTDDKLGVVPRPDRLDAVPSTPFCRRGERRAEWRLVPSFASGPVPLSTLYLLAPADGAASPEIRPVAAAEAAFELASRCELRLPPRVRQRLGLTPFETERFHDGGALAARVRVCRLRVPRDLTRLPDVYDAVVADLAGLR
jgi:hypothetical protein